MNRLKKISRHDVENRDKALVYINGEIYECEVHNQGVQEYLNKNNIDVNVTEEDEDGFAFREDYEDKGAIDSKDEIAFAHYVEQNGHLPEAVYLETDTLQADLNKVLEALKNKYPGLHILDDSSYDAPEHNWNVEYENNNTPENYTRLAKINKYASWIEGPIEVEDEIKKYFIDTFGDAGLETYESMNNDGVSYIESGRLSVDDIKSLKGFNGEDHKWTGNGDNRFFGKYREKDWKVFLEDISNNGIKEPIELCVDRDGKTTVKNGNHRLQAAIQLNLNDVPVIVKYRNNSEEKYKI